MLLHPKGMVWDAWKIITVWVACIHNCNIWGHPELLCLERKCLAMFNQIASSNHFTVQKGKIQLTLGSGRTVWYCLIWVQILFKLPLVCVYPQMRDRNTAFLKISSRKMSYLLDLAFCFLPPVLFPETCQVPLWDSNCVCQAILDTGIGSNMRWV